MKQRNYTIEFFRIMFAINFLAVHVYMVYASAYTGLGMVHIYALDNILPFMIFAGYFLMHGFKRANKAAAAAGVSPGRQATDYLKTRIMGLLPAFLAAQLAGFALININQKTPLIKWPVALLNHICELAGLQITGMGMGNGFVGLWGEAPRSVQMLNSPMWFISGIFICGYLTYYLLAKCENFFLSLIAPFFTIIFYASQFILNSNPNWFNWRIIEGFGGVAEAFPHMFTGLSIGCIIWAAVDSLKDKKFSGGMKALMTVCQFSLGFIIIYKTWMPVNIPGWGQLITINWASVHVLSIFFSFFVLLNADGFTKLLNLKIWAVPGRLAFYVYMFHYPVIVASGKIMGINTAPDLTLLYIVATAVTLIISIAFMLFNDKVIQPWFKSKPWFIWDGKNTDAAA
jgi:peptidoglycan/LPS O-acetylase OafA/YrhL